MIPAKQISGVVPTGGSVAEVAATVPVANRLVTGDGVGGLLAGGTDPATLGGVVTYPLVFNDGTWTITEYQGGGGSPPNMVWTTTATTVQFQCLSGGSRMGFFTKLTPFDFDKDFTWTAFMRSNLAGPATNYALAIGVSDNADKFNKNQRQRLLSENNIWCAGCYDQFGPGWRGYTAINQNSAWVMVRKRGSYLFVGHSLNAVGSPPATTDYVINLTSYARPGFVVGCGPNRAAVLMIEGCNWGENPAADFTLSNSTLTVP